MKPKFYTTAIGLLFLYLNVHSQPINYFFEDFRMPINDIEVINHQEFWVATDSGLYQYTNYGKQVQGIWSPFSSSKKMVGIEVQGLDRYAASSKGLYHYDGTQWQKIIGHSLTGIKQIELDLSGNLWIISDQDSLYKYNGIKVNSQKQMAADIAIHLNDVYIAGAASLVDSGYHYNGSTWDTLPGFSPTPSAPFPTRIHKLEVDDKGQLFALSHSAIYKLQNNAWTVLIDTAVSPQSCFIPYENELIVFNNSPINFSIFQIGSNTIKKFNNVFYDYLTQINAASIYGNTLWLSHEIVRPDQSAHSLTLWNPSQSVKSQYEALDINKIEAGVSAAGALFTDNYGHFEMGKFKVDGITAMFKSNYWFSAVNGTGELYSQAGMHGESGTNFYSGPKADFYDSTYLAKYNRVWKVSKKEINKHRKQHQSSGYVTPDAILNWPGNGIQANGEAKFLAPFHDDNFNGKYEPLLGETPDIRGDQALFYMINDDRGPKCESPGPKMGLEVHGMLYAYDSVQEPSLHQSVFLSLNIHNRSSQSYSNMRFGLWNDIDLGNHVDDAFGSDSISEVFYAYNSDNLDEGPHGFGSNPPALLNAFLNGPLDGFMYYNNSSSLSNGNPESILDFTNLMHGQWKDGEHLSIETPSGPFNPLNGDGHDPSGLSAITKYAYNDSAQWFYNPANTLHHRNIGYTKMGTLNAGESACVDLVFAYARDSNQVNSLGSVVLGKSYVQTLRTFYTTQNYDCMGVALSDTKNELKSYLVYPNPAQAGDKITLSLTESNAIIRLLNLMGQEVAQYKWDKTGEMAIDLPAYLKTGVYILTVNGKREYTTKIVVY